MNENFNTIKYFILILLDDMQKLSVKSYVKSMNSILKGKEGPVADLFKDSVSYGKLPELSLETFSSVMKELVESTCIAKLINSNGKFYYKKLSKPYVENRINFNRLFGVTNYFNDYRNRDDIYDYFPQRSPILSDVYSETGELNIVTVTGQNKVVVYESSIEKQLIQDLEEFEYIKDIVEQPIDILKGKNNDRHYIPDFLIQTYHNHLILIEVKCLYEMTTYSVLKNFKLLEDYAYSQHMIPSMITLHNKVWITLRDIRNRKTNIALERKVMEIIQLNNKISNDEYQELSKKIDCDELDIHHIILKNNLKKKGKWNNFFIEK